MWLEEGCCHQTLLQCSWPFYGTFFAPADTSVNSLWLDIQKKVLCYNITFKVCSAYQTWGQTRVNISYILCTTDPYKCPESQSKKTSTAGEKWTAQVTHHSSCTAPSNVYKLSYTGYLLSDGPLVPTVHKSHQCFPMAVFSIL